MSNIEKVAHHIREAWPSLSEDGIGPGADSIVSAAAVGLVETVWRNSPVEDAHASHRGPHDGQMMAQSLELYNVAIATLRRQPLTLLDFEDYVLDFERMWRGTTRTVKDMLYGQLGAFRKHVKKEINLLLAIEDKEGYEILLGFLCLKTRFSGSNHFGMPDWPRIITAAINHLRRPDDPCWHDHYESSIQKIPRELAARPDELSRILINEPWKFDSEKLDALINSSLFMVGQSAISSHCAAVV